MREAIRLGPGTEIEVRVVGSHIEIEPAPLAIKLVRRGSLTVAIAADRTKMLTASDVRAATEAVRGERDSAGRSSR